MILKKPEAEFISLEMVDIVTISGPAVEYCKQHGGDSSMQVAQLCYTMLETVSADWEDICGMSSGDPSMSGHV